MRLLTWPCRYYAENPTELPALANTRIVGLCTGLLAASVVASARSLSELLPLATEAVRIAFRAGTCVGAAKDALENATNAKDSWSTIVTGISEKDAKSALATFHDDRLIPASARAYVSAVSVMALTISGPPSTTKRLFQEVESFKNNTRVPIPVFAPYHAPHIYNQSDIDRILDKDATRHLQQFRPLALVHSATHGKCQTATNTLDLVQIALGEILLEPVRWDNLLGEVVSQVSAVSSAQCTVAAIGITNVANSLASALKSGGQTNISIRDQSLWSNTTDESRGRTQNDKIAIVGMSGRFPGAASPDKLWELLEKGLDVHREVPADRFDAKAHCDPSHALWLLHRRTGSIRSPFLQYVAT
jgi:hypothetical protein